MKFGHVGPVGEEVPVVFDGDKVLDIRPYTAAVDGDFLANGVDKVRAAFAAGELQELEGFSGERVGSPIARPSAVICVGMNYAAHAAESGAEPPKNMVIFNKLPNTVVGPNDQVTIPKGSTKTDWEVELGVVIGKRASYLEAPEQSRDHIAGFVLANDLSEREWQLELSGGQWGKGKSAPGFSPVGPWLVTADEIDEKNLGLRSWVNGEVRQDSNTSDLIFSVDHIVWELSQYMTLEPGDLILTGTPEGVALSGRFPYLKDGDVVEMEIDGLGRQRQVCVAYS